MESDTEAEREPESSTDTPDEPTGADPDGTVDVASNEAETVPAEPGDNKASGDEPVKSEDSAFSAAIQGKQLQQTLDYVTALVDECKFRIEATGLSIRAVDPANVGMVDLFLPAGAFESWRQTDDETVLGIPLERMDEIVGMADGDELVQFELDAEARQLNFSISNISYTLSLIDPDAIRQEPDIPELDLTAEVVFDGSQFSRGIAAADMVSEHIRFAVTPRNAGGATEDTFHIQANGDVDDVDLSLTGDDVIDIDAGEADSLFALDYLKSMQKPIGKNDEISMELGEEFPMKFHTQYAEGGEVTYMLAPRIDS